MVRLDVNVLGGRCTKRSMDLVLGGLMILLALVPLVLAAVAIKLEDGGRVFFRQQRIGRGGRRFRVLKLRTMSVMREAPSGPDRLHRGDARITRVGAVLRKLGIDELPQLFNVMGGTMSLVGPRPTLGFQVAEYNSFQRRRLEAKAGITSLAVVSGRNALPWDERIKLDIWYIDHWSLGLDVSILFRTLWKVLVTREGLYASEGFNDGFVSASRDGRDESNGPRGLER